MAQLLSNTRIYGFGSIDTQLVVGNVSPIAATSNTTGSLVVAGGVGIAGDSYTNDIYITGQSGLHFTDGTTQYTNAASYGYSVAASAVANSAQANTIYIQGGLNSANANITILYGIESSQNSNIALLQGAMASANANVVVLYGIEASQNANIALLQGAMTSANSNIALLQSSMASANANISVLYGIETTQNTNIQNAYNQANAANILAQAAFNQANLSSGVTSASALGWNANTLLVANQSGYISNTSNLLYFASNNSLYVGANLIANTITTQTGSGANLYLDPDGLADVVLTQNTELFVLSTASSNSNTSGAIVVTGGVGVSGNVYANAIYTDNFFYNANGLPWQISGGGGGGGSSTLAGLTDVSITSPANNQALLYNSTTSKWNNSTFLFDRQYTKLGVLTPFVDQSNRWYPSTNVVINSILVTLGSAPTGSNASISICKNAVPFTTISIVNGTTSGNTYNTPVTANVGDYINININSGGTSSSGSDLYITFRYYRT